MTGDRVAGSGSSAAAGGKTAPKAEDADLIAALEGAKVEWQGGAGKSVLMVENLECKEEEADRLFVLGAEGDR